MTVARGQEPFGRYSEVAIRAQISLAQRCGSSVSVWPRCTLLGSDTLFSYLASLNESSRKVQIRLKTGSYPCFYQRLFARSAPSQHDRLR